MQACPVNPAISIVWGVCILRVDNRAGTVLGKSSKLSGLELNEPADVQCDGLQLSAFGDESTSPTHMGVSERVLIIRILLFRVLY